MSQARSGIPARPPVGASQGSDADRRNCEARAQGDPVEQSRVQRLYLEFNQLAWHDRRSVALKNAAQVLQPFGYQISALDEKLTSIQVTGWGEERVLPFPELKAFLRNLVQPRQPADHDGLCVNCRAAVRLDDPECWNCAASFSRSGFKPRPAGRAGVTPSAWVGRLRELLKQRV